MVHRSRSHPMLSLAAVLALLLALVPAASVAQEVEPIDEATALLASEINTVEVVERYGPSVVSVLVRVEGQPTGPFSPIQGDEGPIQEGAGSGFLIESADEPFLVTNYHVVELALEPDSVRFRDGGEVAVTFPSDPDDEFPVEVVGVNSSFDLALLRLEDPADMPPAEPLEIADSSELQVGQKTIAIGNPFGLASSVSEGIVSAIGRFVPTIGRLNVPMIQTDAAINPGNSGGPLLDSRGELIGINTALINPSGRSFAGLGFAVPSGLLEESLANLRLGGVTEVGEIRPRLGISALSVDLIPPEVGAELDLPPAGVAVVEVEPGSVAEAAGLRPAEDTAVLEQGLEIPIPRDIIVAVGDERIESVEELSRIVTFESDPGDTLALTVVRDGREETIAVTLEVDSDNEG